MAESCTTFPTLTSTGERTTQSFSTTTSTTTTTGPPTIITTSTLGCSAPALPGATTTCIPTPIPVTTTIPGTVQTVQVPITLTVDVIITQTTTLFGSSCTTAVKSSDPAPPPPSSTPPPPPPPTFSSSVITSVASSTQSNGSVVYSTVTTTTGIPVPTNVQNPKDDSPNNVAPIVGGAVGGFFGLIAIVALIWFILKRKRRWDDIFDKEDDEIIAAAGAGTRRNQRFSLDVDVEPKPYQYGLVGQATAPHPASPPHSPPMRPSIPSNNLSHARSSSLSPLNVPMASLVSHPSATTISSRPSTAGSTQPLRPPSQQGYFQPQQQPARPGDFGRSTSATPSGAHSHSHSSGSFTSPPVSLSNWSASTGPGYVGPAMMGMGAGSTVSDDHLYNRSGSPTSILEPRRLQVANLPLMSPASDVFDPFASSSAAAAAIAMASTTAVPQRDGKGRLRMSTEKAPVVHLDGGRVQQELEARSSAAGGSAGPSGVGPSPPAYEA